MIAAARDIMKIEAGNVGPTILYMDHFDPPCLSRYCKNECHIVVYIKRTTFPNLFSNVGC